MDDFSIYEKMAMNFDAATGGMAPLLLVLFLLVAGLVYDAAQERSRRK